MGPENQIANAIFNFCNLKKEQILTCLSLNYIIDLYSKCITLV